MGHNKSRRPRADPGGRQRTGDGAGSRRPRGRNRRMGPRGGRAPPTPRRYHCQAPIDNFFPERYPVPMKLDLDFLDPEPVDPSPPPPPDPDNLMAAVPASGRHYAQLVLADVPEDSLDEDDAARLARLIYAGSYVAFWQYLCQYRRDLPFEKQDKIIQRALAYIKHVESLQLAPLRLTERDLSSEDGIVQKVARVRARLLEVTKELRTVKRQDSPQPTEGSETCT